MRGCLFILVLAAVVGGAAVWFGGPPLATAVVRSTLTSSGFAADKFDVKVTAEPPLTLAVGRASSIAITATGVSWNGLRMRSLELDLGAVDLIGRTAATADGFLGGVQISGPGDQPVAADVVLSGPADAAPTTIRVDGATVSAVALAAFEAKFGIRPSSATLAEPDVIKVGLGGLSVSGHLSIAADGSIVATANGATIRLLAPDPSLPLRLTGLSVSATGLVLQGTFDVGTLMR